MTTTSPRGQWVHNQAPHSANRVCAHLLWCAVYHLSIMMQILCKLNQLISRVPCYPCSQPHRNENHPCGPLCSRWLPLKCFCSCGDWDLDAENNILITRGVFFHITLSHYYQKRWTYKMLFGYILLSGYLRRSPFSQSSFMQYTELYTSSLPILFWRLWVFHPIIIIRSEICFISHCLELGHETMVCVVCLAMFFWVFLHWTMNDSRIRGV